MTLIIHNGVGGVVNLTAESSELVRYAFNPSAKEEVSRIKTLTSALIAELQAQQHANPAAGREFAVAITNVQTASMWAVLAATKGL